MAFNPEQRMATGKKEDKEATVEKAAEKPQESAKAEKPAEKVEKKPDKATVLKEKLKESSGGLVDMLEGQADEGLWESFIEAHAQEVGKTSNVPPEDARKMLGKLLDANFENIVDKKKIDPETLGRLINVINADKKKKNAQEKAA